MKKRTMFLLVALISVLCLTSGALAENVFQGQASGYKSDIVVEVEVEGNQILSVTVVSHDETAGISDAALNALPNDIVAAQTYDVDAKSGATATSEAVIEAVRLALEEAGWSYDPDAAVVVTAEAVEAVEATYDVVIVGGGGAGLVAATAAAEAGASVLVLEKMSFLGGNTLISGGVMNAVNPEWQEPLGIEDSYEFYFNQTHGAGDYMGQVDLVRVLTENSTDALFRTIERGLDFDQNVTIIAGSLHRRSHRPLEPAGTGWVRAYTEAAEAAGADIWLNTEVTSVIREGQLSGRVIGVEAIGAQGEAVTVFANKAVILATGGFGQNVAMRSLHNPMLDETVPSTNQPGITGDGIIMGQDVGGATTGMDYIQLLSFGDPRSGALPGFITSSPYEVIFVNRQGERFVDEGARRDVMVNALFAQEDNLMYMISDSKSYVDPAEFGMSTRRLIEEGRVFEADTLEELAAAINVPADSLVATVARYNEIVAEGFDADFGKTHLENTIDEGPFYAAPRVPTVHHTMGGLVINTDAQVIDRRGNVIPGLYAAGEVTGGIHGTNRVGGNALTDIAVFGWIAGENAAAE